MKTVIEEILNNLYDVSVCSAPVEAVLWSLDRMVNKDLAKRELKEINRIRTRHGIIPVRVPYGHFAF